ncbi:MAG: hypothetical protein H6825_12525 [Planctomycetes bacterium]|nr:hypothetical protein [Planctomycetota bacterium]
MRGAPDTALKKLRPFALPIVALVLALSLLRKDFDVDDVRAALADGDPERALELLSSAREGDLIEPLVTNVWMTAGQRASRLAALRARPADERSEALDAPTLVAPRGEYRAPPTTLRLREALDRPVRVALHGVELGLDMTTVDVPAGALEAPIGVTVLAGTTVSLTLTAADDSLMPALAWFRTLDAERARLVGIVLATAEEIAGDDARADALLTGIVALDYSLLDEALTRLRPLLADPDYGRLARELCVIALDAQGLDASALALLDGG